MVDHVLYYTCVGIRTSCVQLLYRLKLSRMRANVIITWHDMFGRLLAAIVIVISICPMISNSFITSVWIGCWTNFEFIVMSECMVVIWHTIFTNRCIIFPEFWIVPSPPIFLGLKTSVFNLPLITTVCFRGFRTSTSAACLCINLLPLLSPIASTEAVLSLCWFVTKLVSWVNELDGGGAWSSTVTSYFWAGACRLDRPRILPVCSRDVSRGAGIGAWFCSSQIW